MIWVYYISVFIAGIVIGWGVSEMLLNADIRRRVGIAKGILDYHYEICPNAPTYTPEQRRELRKKAAAIVASRDVNF